MAREAQSLSWLVIARVALALARHGMAQDALALSWLVARMALGILFLVMARLDLVLRLVAGEALTLS